MLTGTPNTVHHVNLRSPINGSYVCSDFDHDGVLFANRFWRRQWEDFAMKELGGGLISLFSPVNNRYVCADYDKGGILVANRTWQREWETFELKALEGNQFALRVPHTDRYVCADFDHHARLVANRTWAREWETFEITLAVLDPDIVLEEIRTRFIARASAHSAHLRDLFRRVAIGPQQMVPVRDVYANNAGLHDEILDRMVASAVSLPAPDFTTIQRLVEDTRRVIEQLAREAGEWSRQRAERADRDRSRDRDHQNAAGERWERAEREGRKYG